MNIDLSKAPGGAEYAGWSLDEVCWYRNVTDNSYELYQAAGIWKQYHGKPGYQYLIPIITIAVSKYTELRHQLRSALNIEKRDPSDAELIAAVESAVSEQNRLASLRRYAQKKSVPTYHMVNLRNDIGQLLNLEFDTPEQMLEVIANLKRNSDAFVNGVSDEWDGEGLPPVGVECEVYFNDAWHRIIPRSYHKKPDAGDRILGDVLKHGCNEWRAGYVQPGFKFRPIETPEQRDVNQAMCDIDAEKGDCSPVEGVIRRMLAAGYRK